MHGVILYSLGKFVNARYGDDGWQKVLAAAGRPDAHYLPTQLYPDHEAMKLVGAAARVTGRPVDEILDAFGEFVAPTLLSMYDSLLEPGWRTLELIENIEETIHFVVRMKSRGAEPPHLRCKRNGPDEVLVMYDSERRMCAVATGIIRGVARHYEETVEVTQPRCMHRGDSQCEILVRRLP